MHCGWLGGGRLGARQYLPDWCAGLAQGLQGERTRPGTITKTEKKKELKK